MQQYPRFREILGSSAALEGVMRRRCIDNLSAYYREILEIREIPEISAGFQCHFFISKRV